MGNQVLIEVPLAEALERDTRIVGPTGEHAELRVVVASRLGSAYCFEVDEVASERLIPGNRGDFCSHLSPLNFLADSRLTGIRNDCQENADYRWVGRAGLEPAAR
jgi:hypothetical protein